MRIGVGWLMNALLFPILAASELAQGTTPQPLELGEDKLYASTAEFMAQHPNCFMPTENLPTNYKVWRYVDHGQNRFSCRITSTENDRLQMLGFSVKMKQAVIADDHVVAVFYDLPRREFSAMESRLRERLGGPTEENLGSYIGRNGCKGKEIHWRNEVSDIVLVDQCENDKYGAAVVNLFYTRRADFSTKPSE
jgi:hypothetical protein